MDRTLHRYNRVVTIHINSVHNCTMHFSAKFIIVMFYTICSVLASLNLPAALEDISGSNKVPQSLLDKAKQVQDLGGMQHLDKLINDLPELLCRNREILDDVCTCIDIILKCY